MKKIFENKFVRYGLFAGGALLVLIILFVVWLFGNLLVSSSGLYDAEYEYSAPSISGSTFESNELGKARSFDAVEDMSLSAPISTGGSISNLEAHETTDYRISGQTRDFEKVCAALTQLKTDDRFDFRNLNETLNRCSATFYASEADASTALERIGTFSDLEVSRNTVSVTAQRERLDSRTDILRQQLESVERTLSNAELQFDEIIEIARASNDASELATAINNKINLVESLTQRKIRLNDQINQALRQAQDLQERTEVVAFNVSISRSVPVRLNETSQAWEQAWEELKERLTDTGIGLTTGLAIVLLFAVQTVIYLLIAIVAVRLLWRFVKMVWRKL